MSDLISSNRSDRVMIPGLHKKSSRLNSSYKSFIFYFFLFQVYRTNFKSFIKLLRIIVRLIIRRKWQNTELTPYDIEETIESTTTKIFFSYSKRTGIDIYMKLWPKRKMANSSPEDPTKQLKDLVEGFTFNRHFARGVYLGVAPVVTLGEGTQKILRGGLIFNPSIDDLKPGEYVIVMRNVQKEWKLDYLLSLKRSNLRTRKDMEFLAKQVARMHNQLESLSHDKIRPDLVASKLAFNIERLGQALQMFGDAAMEEKYDYICRVMNTAYDNYRNYFEQRCRGGYLKRCHGDLKTTNLWVSPWRILPRKLFALDCIDFNPDFCHIDTLSDIAMLAVDIQQVMSGSDENNAEKLTMHFLEVYCQEMRENDVCVQPLLKYYMTEKAIVCSYVSMLLDDSPKLGEKYFAIAHLLAQQLEHLLIRAVPVFPSEQGSAMLTN